jgi:methionyl-tRNA synthetase
MKPIIPFDTFAQMDLRIGKVLECVEKEGSEKLLKLTVDFGEEGQRTILTGVKQWYTPEDLSGRNLLFIINLEPRKMMGEFSEGMVLMAEGAEKPIPLIPADDVAPGATIR